MFASGICSALSSDLGATDSCLSAHYFPSYSLQSCCYVSTDVDYPNHCGGCGVALGLLMGKTPKADKAACPDSKDSQQWPSIRHVAAEVATKATQLSDSIFAHMMSEEALASAAVARQRALMLVDVLVERHSTGRLKKRWLVTAALVTFCYLRYALPALSCWGNRHFEHSVGESEFAETVGGPSSRVSFAVLVVVTLTYLSMLQCSARLMEARLPIRNTVFEILVVYNMTQMLLNAYVCTQLLREAWAQGFHMPWGNTFNYTKESHRLGYYIWFHYHLCQLELFDTLFVVIRKKFEKMTFLHVWLRLLNMWAWFAACRYACGGDTYFPAATNAATRAVVYAFYSLSLLTTKGIPLFRKARVTGVQMLQFGVCAVHALFCLYKFWDMSIPRTVLVVYFLVMTNGLMLYTDFHYQAEGKSKPKSRTEPGRNVSIAFDSSGWMYCYHFGVAAWLREHILPEGLSPEESCTDKFPANITFSGSSGGALVAAVLSMGLEPSAVFEMVLKWQPQCCCNPFRMLPAVEDVVKRQTTKNAFQSMTGRCRVLLTRVSLRYPFLTAEVVNQFRDNQDVFHALRASCHVPVIGGLLPYRYDGHYYLDGMFWPQMLVPWKGTQHDFVVRISALLSGPSSDIRPPIMPTWWSLFPPREDVLRGIYWLGYLHAASWFTQVSPDKHFECFSFVSSAGMRHRSIRKTSTQSDSAAAPNGETAMATPKAAEDDARSSTRSAAQKLLLKKPSANLLPDVDPVTGGVPREYLASLDAAMWQDRRRAAAASVAILVPVLAWFLMGWS
eukprot:TRINITY_DN26180_c0_g1_i2.p1 TRINITY_DN26180_c0_g1~~TRINITY_DN26180_c0_g1_i2.p1  ORF type:complete len:787 (+),score=76.14 TRINITY_DN26180_c0_g1_i2:54-2414(+)